MSYFICLWNENTLELVPLKIDLSGRFGTCDAQSMSTFSSKGMAEIEVRTVLAHLRSMTAGQLLDAVGFYKMEVHIRSTETLDYENLNDSEVEGAYTVYPVVFRSGIVSEPYGSKACLTVLELKRLIANWPELNDDGLLTEVWVSGEAGLSNPAKAIVSLNNRGHYADLMIEF